MFLGLRRTMGVLLLCTLVGGCGGATAAPAHEVASSPAPTPPALEREMREIQVVMFMTRWCPHCQRARSWLQEGGYKFIELDVEEDRRAAMLLKTLNPRGSVPLFDVDGQIVVGFDPRILHAALRRAVEIKLGGGGTGFAALP